MSGHGGFSAIGSGMKVPQPFDLPKVEDIQLGKDKLGALNVEGHKVEVQIADTRLDQTNRLAANLDAMLLRAAKTASAPVEAKALKDTLVAAGLDKATRKSIEGAAKKAQTSFQAINQFSGRQIADALVKDEKGRFGWDEANPVGKAIKAALDAQADLSELLYNALNSLPATANARARNALMEAMFQTDRRASELQTLVCDFADMAEKAGDDPAIKARLDKTLESLIPGQSLKMHGSEKIAADFRASLMPLAKRIDDLAAAKERQLSDGEATKIRRQIDEGRRGHEDPPPDRRGVQRPRKGGDDVRREGHAARPFALRVGAGHADGPHQAPQRHPARGRDGLDAYLHRQDVHGAGPSDSPGQVQATRQKAVPRARVGH